MSVRPDPVATARALVAERFPDAVGAWVSGSAVSGGGTPTSDLDVTVVLASAEVRRESIRYADWPVELFVHVEESVAHFVARDLARRRPSMARLVTSGVTLVDGCPDLVAHCHDVLAAGPGPLPPDQLRLARYTLTDLLDDLADRPSPSAETTAVAVTTWQATAELVLAEAAHWTGTGKWLVRELADLDRADGTRWGDRLDSGLRSALVGEPTTLVGVAGDALDLVGGRLWAGFSAAARWQD